MSGQVKRTQSLLARRWLTALESAQMGGCLSLSQRVGDLRRAGEVVIDRWVKTASGARVKSYRWVRATNWTA
jgi:hypothetical protein